MALRSGMPCSAVRPLSRCHRGRLQISQVSRFERPKLVVVPCEESSYDRITKVGISALIQNVGFCQLRSDVIVILDRSSSTALVDQLRAIAAGHLGLTKVGPL